MKVSSTQSTNVSDTTCLLKTLLSSGKEFLQKIDTICPFQKSGLSFPLKQLLSLQVHKKIRFVPKF